MAKKRILPNSSGDVCPKCGKRYRRYAKRPQVTKRFAKTYCLCYLWFFPGATRNRALAAELARPPAPKAKPRKKPRDRRYRNFSR